MAREQVEKCNSCTGIHGEQNDRPPSGVKFLGARRTQWEMLICTPWTKGGCNAVIHRPFVGTFALHVWAHQVVVEHFLVAVIP